MTIGARWYAIVEQLQTAIEEHDLPAMTQIIENAQLLREEDASWADYFHLLLRVPCEHGNLITLEKLIEAGADINKVELFEGEIIDVPLHQAIEKSDLALVEALIWSKEGLKRADLEIPSAWEGQHIPETPLMSAVCRYSYAKEQGNEEKMSDALEIIRLLIRAGAEVNGMLPSHYSEVESFDDELAAKHHQDLHHFVLPYPYGEETLWLVFNLPETAICSTGEPEIIKILLDAGADPNLDGRGEALKMAIHAGSIESVRLLLDAGACIPSAEWWDGPSLLDGAARKGHSDIYEWLLKGL